MLWTGVAYKVVVERQGLLEARIYSLHCCEWIQNEVRGDLRRTLRFITPTFPWAEVILPQDCFVFIVLLLISLTSILWGNYMMNDVFFIYKGWQLRELDICALIWRGNPHFSADLVGLHFELFPEKNNLLSTTPTSGCTTGLKVPQSQKRWSQAGLFILDFFPSSKSE